MSDLDKTFFDQVREAARISRKHSKLNLVSQLLESNRVMSADARQIHKLGDEVKRLRAALEEIIASEEEQAIRSYGLGDIARQALAQNRQISEP
jgi:hypothetical protein